MKDSDYYSFLYQVSRSMNKEFSLHAVLKTALEKSVELLGLETGWVWLMQENGAVYLAASYKLPPALKDFPERLSGSCYCIEKYLADNMEESSNISEIVCSRLYDLKSGTKDLKFHATVPVKVNDQKVGLINLLSSNHQELSSEQFCVLNTLSELIGVAVQRTRAQDTQEFQSGTEKAMFNILQRVFKPKLLVLKKEIELVQSHLHSGNQETLKKKLAGTANLAEKLHGQLSHILDEFSENPTQKPSIHNLHFPASPLTQRELELLAFVRKGYTNRQIADAIFISERTVKFHMSSILQKLSSKTRTEAVNIALKRGLLNL